MDLSIYYNGKKYSALYISRVIYVLSVLAIPVFVVLGFISGFAEVEAFHLFVILGILSVFIAAISLLLSWFLVFANLLMGKPDFIKNLSTNLVLSFIPMLLIIYFSDSTLLALGIISFIGFGLLFLLITFGLIKKPSKTDNSTECKIKSVDNRKTNPNDPKPPSIPFFP
ncbi:MAG: hypothetical protein ABIH83_06020 [Candidatus Micrarchaeota archaeon]